MSNTRTPIAPALVLRRTYAAPRQRVFDAWTTPELAVKFLGPDGVTVPEVQMDVRTGGSYKIGMQMSDGERWYVGGTYREVRPPERIVMTWRWEEDKPEDEHESLLTLEFNERDGGTELVLTHERLASDESRDGHEKGWAAILEKLGTVL
ncbi:MAG TPA: SRPBCC domain-containing protein [Candidatus Cybelea sp.]